MRASIQDVLRGLIGGLLTLFGRRRRRAIRKRIQSFKTDQRALVERYGLRATDPILLHGAELQGGIDDFAQNSEEPVRFAETSGSTGVPKRIAYTRSRVKSVVGVYIDAFARAYAALPVRRKSLYVMSSLNTDSSLSALMMEEKAALPPYFSGLQAPYRVQGDPALQELAQRYGSHALRTWVLAISNPGVLYCTNPSTLSTYLDALEEDWSGASAMVRDWVNDQGAFSAAARRVARRISSRGDRARLREIAAAKHSLGLLRIAPAVEMFSCWDGGYVRPFLDRIRARLPGERVRHLPMYSMSTEVIETLPVFEEEELFFLPLAEGVRYEFLPAEADDDPRLLREAWEIEEGQEVLMVVSDAYGLRRYQTEDVFRCEGHLEGLPHLRFMQRRGLAWSFTGEKLTGQQIELAFAQLKKELPVLEGLDWMALVPTQPEGAAIPGYLLLLVGSGLEDPNSVAARFDAVMGGLNGEFADKLKSGRLASTVPHGLRLEDYVAKVGGRRHKDSWEAQFKFLPLVCKLWEQA